MYTLLYPFSELITVVGQISLVDLCVQKRPPYGGPDYKAFMI
jgi:hypothetical protein